MMDEQFTIEEINMMCIFDISSRDALISELEAAITHLGEPELTGIAEAVINKLSKMGDAEFTALAFNPEYGDYNDE